MILSEYKSHIQMILLSLCSRVSLYRLYIDTDSVSQIKLIILQFLTFSSFGHIVVLSSEVIYFIL